MAAEEEVAAAAAAAGWGSLSDLVAAGDGPCEEGLRRRRETDGKNGGSQPERHIFGQTGGCPAPAVAGAA